MREGLRLIGVMLFLLLQGLTWAAEPVAVLTEIRPGRGEVLVQRAGDAQWTTPQPLLSLRPGDQIRTSGDGQAVLVFVGGLGAQTVSAANSPYAIQTPTRETGVETLRTIVASVTQFLVGQQKDLTYLPARVRGPGSKVPLILSPRETRLLSGPPIFEWTGSDLLRYRIRVFSPQGLLWEQTDLPRRPLTYPESAPPLRPGVSYTWELDAKGSPVQRARFELLPPPEAARVREALSLLQPGSLRGYPGSTIVVMRGSLLFQKGLYHEGRRELLAAIADNPQEPTLHLLLGRVYERMGLEDLAAEAFEEAQFLTTSKP